MISRIVLDIFRNSVGKPIFPLVFRYDPQSTFSSGPIRTPGDGLRASVVFIEIKIDHLEKPEILSADDQNNEHQYPPEDIQQAPSMGGGSLGPVNSRESPPAPCEDRSSEQTQDPVWHVRSPHTNF